jgi:FtsP/CotA-like multicopper oxidase with cupredoxin domain
MIMKKGKKKDGLKITRRQFLKGAAVAGIGMALPLKFGVRSAHAFYQSPTTIPLFGTSLRGVGPAGIPVAAPDAFTAPVTGVTHYTIDINPFQDSGVVPTLGATTLWGYNPVNPLGPAIQAQKHLGGIIVGEKGIPIQITFRNNLLTPHIIPNDLTIPGAALGDNRTAVHFHGGLVPWISDGGPFDWWNPTGGKGASFLNNQVLRDPLFPAAPNEAEYYYPLNQSARFGWYHDHAFGITRINAYAGIASGLLIRDTFERSLFAKGLPQFIETSVLSGGAIPIQELPLVIQDKIFVDAATIALDPTWTGVKTSGSLWYPHTYERNRWRLSGNVGGKSVKNPALPDPSVIPEMFGDTMLVNGTAFPQVTVEARRYRLRFLNACNARFLNLQFYIGDASPNGITLNPATGIPTNAPAMLDPNALTGVGLPNVLQIGTEGGFLPKPVNVPTNLPFNPVTLTGSLIVAPAERPDILVDFSHCVNQTVILYNDAPAPFPVGDPRNDYFPLWNVKGNPVNGLTPNGFGPNSRVLMRFNVVAATGASDLTLNINTTTDLQSGNDPLFMPPGVTVPPPVNKTRLLTLNENFDIYGRLQQLLGTNVPLASPSAGFGRAYLDAATEMPLAGQTEIWEIYNLTADVHPMHFHLVNVQVINRQVFQNFNGTATFKALPTPPAPNETGWKETVPMYPGTVTRIIMKFDLTQAAIKTAGGATIATPSSPRTGGAEYVWHCHILEHEEHDMMRPLVVI